MHAVDYDFHQIAAAVKSEFNLAATDVANVVKNTLGLPSDMVNAVLKVAGYVVGDIEKAMSSAFDRAASHLNPSHW